MRSLAPGVGLGLALALFASPIVADALANSLAALQKEQNIPAMGWIILLPDQTPRIEVTGAGTDPSTPFRFGSITKTLTAITLMNAAELSGISLDTPLDQVVETRQWRNNFAEPLTLRHLVSLTAGHTDLGLAAFNDNTPHGLEKSLQLNQDALTSWWPPGLVHGYSNATPGLSSLAIEKLTRGSFASAMSQLLFEPLGLQQASLSPDPALPGGFRADGTTPIEYWHTTFQAFGALNMSMPDMARFLQAVLAGGRYAGRKAWSDATQEALLVPSVGLAHAAGLKIGYAAGMYSRVKHGLVWHTHGGDADGYRSRYAVLPEHKAGYAIAFNTDNPRLLERFELILEKYIAESLELPKSPPLASQPITTRYDGDYYPITTRFELEGWRACKLTRMSLKSTRRGIEISRGQTVTRLNHVGSSRFAATTEPAATAVITKDAAGSIYFLGEYGSYARIKARNDTEVAVVPPFLSACVSQ